MKTLGARLALGYALLSTLTLFSLLATGYFLLNRHVTDGLDLLNRSEAERINAALQSAPTPRTEDEIIQRLRLIAPAESMLFLMEFYTPDGRLLFRSANLADQTLPNASTQDLRLPSVGLVRVGTFPLPSGQLRLAKSEAEVREMMNTYAGMSFLLVCLILIASLVTGMLLSQAALRPVRAIQETANRIRSDNLGMRIPVPESDDEIASLARLLNEMFDRLESSFTQIRRFSAETSHELKTPLSLIRLHAEKLLLEENLTPAQQEMLQVVMQEVENLSRIVEDLLFLSRVEAQAITADLKRQDPRMFLEDFTEDARTLTEHRGVRFELLMTGNGEVDFDSRQLRQVLLNLVANAVNVSPAGGLITLESDFTIDSWRLAVEDDGPGVPENDRERIFDRFVRLNSDSATPSKGSGLGLTVCRSLIGLHRGSIRAEAGPRRGGLRAICEIPVPKASTSTKSLRAERSVTASFSPAD